MRVLVACEFSGVVRRAFKERGHEVWSCDLLPADDGEQIYHFQDDVRNVIEQYQYDLMIAHPPCTYLCNSGVRWLRMPKDTLPYEDFWDYMDREEAQKVANRWGELEYARAFFRSLLNAPIPKIAVENPIPHKYAELPKYDQTIQPYMFGDDASKRTCLWLKGLPKLSIPPEDSWITPRIVNGRKLWANQTPSGQNKLGPSETRASERSRTYDGIANAFAEQWG